MKFKFYTWVIKRESLPVADVEGHALGLNVRNAFYAFENGEVATSISVGWNDYIKGAGPFMQYLTFTFEDGSTIIVKNQGTAGGAAAQWKSEIIKGTGRFQGITGTLTSKAKYLPVEKWEVGPKGYGEGTLTFTLPSK
jgi:hypothetical protein